jgi:hypothetical protein
LDLVHEVSVKNEAPPSWVNNALIMLKFFPLPVGEAFFYICSSEGIPSSA